MARFKRSIALAEIVSLAGAGPMARPLETHVIGLPFFSWLVGRGPPQSQSASLDHAASISVICGLCKIGKTSPVLLGNARNQMVRRSLLTNWTGDARENLIRFVG